MKKTTKIFSIYLILLLLAAGCVEETIEQPNIEESKNSFVIKMDNEQTEKVNEKIIKNTNITVSEETTKLNNGSVGEKVQNKAGIASSEQLSSYSSEQIEYARVWLQLGVHQQIDELNVVHIKAGTLLNPDDETSLRYPEDVIQLAGSRLVDGSVTYSRNDDGTINVYNVPIRWDGMNPAGEKFYKEIIDHTKQVTISAGEDKKIINLIRKLNKETWS